MKLEQQVCSLELAKRLKELGVRQESYFVWVQHWEDGPKYTLTTFDDGDRVNEQISAFTVAELGEMLPTFCELEGTNRVFNCWKEPQGWQCAYGFHSGSGDWGLQEALTEADARAKMLIYLLENKLISV